MIQIRPVSDLRNKFPEIESTISNGQPVYLTTIIVQKQSKNLPEQKKSKTQDEIPVIVEFL